MKRIKTVIVKFKGHQGQHALHPIKDDDTLCGDAIADNNKNIDNPKRRWFNSTAADYDVRDGFVTCVDCLAIIEHCRNL